MPHTHPAISAAQVRLFTAKRIEKKLAFVNCPLVYDRPEKIPIGSPCVGELRLRETNAATLRRRQREAETAAVLEVQHSQRPSFELTHAKEPTGLLSQHAGAPKLGTAAFEFLAKGRVPHLLIRIRTLNLTHSGRRAAAALAAAAGEDPESARVRLVVSDSTGVLASCKRRLVTRDVEPRLLRSESDAASLHFEEFLLVPSMHSIFYDRIQQLVYLGTLATASISFTLEDASTGQALGGCARTLS